MSMSYVVHKLSHEYVLDFAQLLENSVSAGRMPATNLLASNIANTKVH